MFKKTIENIVAPHKEAIKRLEKELKQAKAETEILEREKRSNHKDWDSEDLEIRKKELLQEVKDLENLKLRTERDIRREMDDKVFQIALNLSQANNPTPKQEGNDE